MLVMGTAARRLTWPPMERAIAIAAVLVALAGNLASLDGGDGAVSELTVPLHMSMSDKASDGRPVVREDGGRFGREIALGGYIGIPYIYPSSVAISDGKTTDMRIKSVDWVGRPFRSPIYYGLRVLADRGASTLGLLVDFTHSKAIAQKADVLELSGRLKGKVLPERATVAETFRHFEFSHGHNTLAVNGLFRLARLAGGIRPYAGIGAGISIPHTEVQFIGDPVRTYMYQYTGAMAQALAGLEIDIGGTRIFLEYKLTLAPYRAPLMHHSTSWAVLDFAAQIARWWSGRAPEGGWLETSLVSHQVVAGAMRRVMPLRAR